jgi:hypothetical protein
MHAPIAPILTLAVAGAFWGKERPRWFKGIPWAAAVLAMWILTFPILGGVYLMPGARHEFLARALGELRVLPLPGAHRLAWMEAGVEESLGRLEEAEEILRAGKWSEDPWTLFLRGRISIAQALANASSPDGARATVRGAELFDSALARDPRSFAALVGCARTAHLLGDSAKVEVCAERAFEVRPWEAEILHDLRAR